MEFQGRITKLLPMRSGTSARTGNAWQSLPFVFEFFENPTDRYADSVVLETFDTKVIENLKVGMEVVCGFGHKAKDIKRQNGDESTINELRLYKIESVRKAAAHQPQQDGGTGAAPSASAPTTGTATFGPQTEEGGKPNDLPF